MTLTSEDVLLPATEYDVLDEWIDYNGHLSEAYYVLLFGHATDAAMAYVGMGPEYRAATSCSFYTVEAHIKYIEQIVAGSTVTVRSKIIGSDDKRMILWHEMYVGRQLHSTVEILGLHVDQTINRVAPFPPEVKSVIQSMKVPPPSTAGRSIQIGFS